jgi:hypothetical protein
LGCGRPVTILGWEPAGEWDFIEMTDGMIVTDPEILGARPVIKRTRALAYWQLIPPSRSIIWIWQSLT